MLNQKVLEESCHSHLGKQYHLPPCLPSLLSGLFRLDSLTQILSHLHISHPSSFHNLSPTTNQVISYLLETLS